MFNFDTYRHSCRGLTQTEASYFMDLKLNNSAQKNSDSEFFFLLHWVFKNKLIHEWVYISQLQIFHLHTDQTVSTESEKSQEVIHLWSVHELWFRGAADEPCFVAALRGNSESIMWDFMAVHHVLFDMY